MDGREPWMVLEDSVRLVAPISSFDSGLYLVRFSYLVSALHDRWRMRRQRPLRGILSSFSVACNCYEDVFLPGSDWSCSARSRARVSFFTGGG